jgi:hypothetical protein
MLFRLLWLKQLWTTIELHPSSGVGCANNDVGRGIGQGHDIAVETEVAKAETCGIGYDQVAVVGIDLLILAECLVNQVDVAGTQP